MVGPKRRPVLSVVIPVFNEGTNLDILLRLIRPMIPVLHEILIVHDIPDDDSIPVVRRFQRSYPGLRLVHNRRGRGVVNAVKAGVSEASGEYVLVIAADDIGPLLAIEDMLALMDEGCDLVNATRYAHGGRNIGGYLTSRILSRTGNAVFRFLSGSSLTDPTFGVKMFRRMLFGKMMLEAKPVGWAFSFEFAIKAQMAGWKLGEVPLISLNRLYAGRSSFSVLAWIREYTRWFWWGLARRGRMRSHGRVRIKVPEKMRKG